MLDSRNMYKRVEYASTNQKNRVEYIYNISNKNELLSIVEYKNDKKSKVTGYKEGRPEEITEYTYDNETIIKGDILVKLGLIMPEVN